MRIAIPMVGNQISAHFGHCEKFALIDTNPEEKKITTTTYLNSPSHEPGILPAWLHEQGANVIITGGMGQRAISLFTQHGIKTVVGVAEGTPEQIAELYLNGSLKPGESLCDH